MLKEALLVLGVVALLVLTAFCLTQRATIIVLREDIAVLEADQKDFNADLEKCEQMMDEK